MDKKPRRRMRNCARGTGLFLGGMAAGYVVPWCVRFLCIFLLLGDVLGIGLTGMQNQAMYALEAGNSEDALFWANKLIANAPELPVGFVLRGRAQELAGENELALADYSVAIAYTDLPSTYYADRASVLVKLGMHDRAARDYARLIIHLDEMPAPIERTLRNSLSRWHTMPDSETRSATTLLALLKDMSDEIQETPEVRRAIEILEQDEKASEASFKR